MGLEESNVTSNTFLEGITIWNLELIDRARWSNLFVGIVTNCKDCIGGGYLDNANSGISYLYNGHYGTIARFENNESSIEFTDVNQSIGEWKKGEILRVKVDLKEKFEMVFHKNEKLAGKARLEKGLKYYPAISLYSGFLSRDEIQLTF